MLSAFLLRSSSPELESLELLSELLVAVGVLFVRLITCFLIVLMF